MAVSVVMETSGRLTSPPCDETHPESYQVDFVHRDEVRVTEGYLQRETSPQQDAEHPEVAGGVQEAEQEAEQQLW